MAWIEEDKRDPNAKTDWKEWGRIVGALGFAALLYVVFSGWAGSSRSCAGLVPEVARISKDASPLGIKIIDVVEPKTVREEAERTECTGTAILSSAQKIPIKYRTYKEYDKWYVYFEPM